MKKRILLFAFAVICCKAVLAVPAWPHPVVFTQPDGDTLTLLLRGDEHQSFAVTPDGYTLMYNAEGYYCYARLNAMGDMEPSQYVARSQSRRSADEVSFLTTTAKGLHYSRSQLTMMRSIRAMHDRERSARKAFPTTGTRKLICILIGFPDKQFTRTQEEFNNLFNQMGYSFQGATGSVKDYFLEASYGKLDLQVDVAGPFTANNNMAYYGAPNGDAHDIRARNLMAEAVTKADPTVDFSEYDNDGDGVVDGIYVIYAGYGEASGAPANTIWPHAWTLNPYMQVDGVSARSYSCSNELIDTEGSNITGIGVICHEFGHTLGAPDYYDTDYAESGGNYQGTGTWDLQASGSWNNNGRTPPHPNPRTKIDIYKWATATTLNSPATVTMQPSIDNNASFYRIYTTTSGEYYLIENRQKLGFDTYVPGHGLVIYHGSNITANDVNFNTVNATHPQKFYPVAANATVAQPDESVASYGNINSSSCPWPGTGNKTQFTDATTPSMKSWANDNTDMPITNISENIATGVITFDVMGGTVCNPPVNFAVNYTADCEAQLIWQAPQHTKMNSHNAPLSPATEKTPKTPKTNSLAHLPTANATIRPDILNTRAATLSPAVVTHIAPSVKTYSDASLQPAAGSTKNATWLTWNNDSMGTAVGGGSHTLGFFMKFDPSDLTGYAGQYITKVNIHPLNHPDEATVFSANPRVQVYVGGSIVADVEVNEDDYHFDSDNFIDLPTPILITETQDIRFGVVYAIAAGYPMPATSDAATYISGKTDLMLYNGNWYPAIDLYTNKPQLTWYMAAYTRDPLQNTCPVTVEMNDEYGDGWGSQMIFTDENGTEWDRITCNAGAQAVSVMLPQNEVINCRWAPVGNYDNEVSFTIKDSEGTVLYTCAEGSFDDQPAGTFHTFTHTCAPTTTTYNIYRDGNFVANVETLSHTDTGFDATAEHTWSVATVCTGNVESDLASVTKEACSIVEPPCQPVTNLAVSWMNDCSGATVSWNSPTKSSHELLWDNTAGMTNSGYYSTRWMGETSTVRLVQADDFDVPSGESWTVEDVFFAGFANESPLPEHIGIAIYKDNGNNRPQTTAIYENVTLIPAGGVASAEMTVTLPAPFEITEAGKYWISIYGAYNGTFDNGKLYYTNVSSTPNGATMCRWDPEGLYTNSPYIEWTPNEDAQYPSLGFSISGQKTVEQQLYNVYRDDTIIATGIAETVFDDTICNSAQSHTWSVTAVCDNNRESDSASVSKEACSLPTYTVSLSANPTAGGSVSGGGTYNQGVSTTVTATPNAGYNFVNWTEGGTTVSTSANYAFTVTGNRTLVANFALKTYTVSLSANPTAGGNVTGGGTYNHGVSTTVTATPNAGYNFVNWTEGGIIVSTDASYAFSVTGNRTLTANFVLQQFDVTYQQPANGTLTVTTGGTSVVSGSRVNYNTGLTITATPDEGYEQGSLTVNGINFNSGETYTVIADVVIEASFSTATGILNNMLAGDVMVYGNGNKVHIMNNSGVTLKSVQIIDVLGRVVYDSKGAINHTAIVEISVNGAGGIYIVRLVSDDGKTSSTKVQLIR